MTQSHSSPVGISACRPVKTLMEHAQLDIPFVQVTIVEARGSTPRETGAAMTVFDDTISGTIGGGRLEYEAIAHARDMLGKKHSQQPWLRDSRVWPLGPSLGQCCGGTIRLMFEVYTREEIAALDKFRASVTRSALLLHPAASGAPLKIISQREEARKLSLPAARIAGDMLSGARPAIPTFTGASGKAEGYFIEPAPVAPTQLFLYGAGHVGRAIIALLDGLDFDIHWIDTSPNRFPKTLPANTTQVVANKPELIAPAAPAGALHLVLTYSHAIDFEICRVLLQKPAFGFLGLIGSKTKRARFEKHFRECAIPEHTIQRLTSPIGISAITGKEPQKIAISVAAQLIQLQEQARGKTSGQNADQIAAGKVKHG